MTVDTQMNISPVLGAANDDTLTGTGRSEVLSGAGGDDVIYALSGNDEVFGGSGNDILYGQGGNDTIYGNGSPAYVDMSNLTITNTTTATVTFMDEGAGFRNALGVYEIGEDGSISNVQILFANASKQGSGGDLLPGESKVAFDISAGSQLGFFVVSNGFGKGALNQQALTATNGQFIFRNLDGQPGDINDAAVELWWINEETGTEIHIQSQYGFSIFHSGAGAQNGYLPNPDAYSHVVARANAVSGELMIGFEDLYGGGDNDYDDTVIKIEIGQYNVIDLLPDPKGGEGLPDDDVLYGGSGDDTMYGIGGDDTLYGGDGNDVMSGNSGDDTLYGNDGTDTLVGNSGNDILFGGNGNDDLSGSSGNDTLSGDGGNDVLSGGSGDDDIFGGSGDDELSGNADNDLIYGGSGDDILYGNSGDDYLSGDSGSDEINGHSGNDMLFGGAGQDKLIGGSGDDYLSGGEHNDKLYGGSGADILLGGDGNDYLTAGTDDDLINGGQGNDKMIGGAGSDLFIFDFSDGFLGHDTIYDFSIEDSFLLVSSIFTSFDDFIGQCIQSDSDVIISWEDGGYLTLQDFELTNLSTDMFDFI